MKNPQEIKAAARSEALRTLARNGVTCIAYDAIADMVVKVVRTIDHEIDATMTEKLPPEFFGEAAVILTAVRRAEKTIPVNDLIDDLWSDDRIAEVREKLMDIVKSHNIYKHTLRGEIRRDLHNDDFVLIVSGLEKA